MAQKKRLFLVSWAAGCLLLVAGLACLAPAMRALRVQPMTALHYE